MATRRHLANAIRALAMDAVQKANSGHPGAPMGMADIAEVLWNDFLVHDPSNPAWPNRDRFVLSNGHGSMLLYALLHLSGYDLSMDDIRQFRQMGSRTPGHPERGITPGVETTTGPLGQGLANAVGMALAERTLAAQFNRPDHSIIDHHTYVFVGDGCLMEGISHEACSLAGTLGLGKLIAVYDDNGISIDGEVGAWFSDDTPKRFEAYGWQVIADVDGHDGEALVSAFEQARAETQRPSLICARTTIGYGSPAKAGKASAHGAPLGDAEITAARAQLDWTAAAFDIPDDVYAGWDAKARGRDAHQAWQQAFGAYREVYPELATELERRLDGDLPTDWDRQIGEQLAAFDRAAGELATRAASERVLDVLGPMLSELIGGSADLTGSNNTRWAGAVALNEDPAGNYLYYGVREFAMGAIMNGLALHGGFIPYGGTFLVFSDYARNAIRMAALMRIRSVFVLTHDSVGLGEDGPTHQPVEHLSSLRAIPNVNVWRPCDSVETLVAWQAAIEDRDGPSALVLSRQKLSHETRDATALEAIRRGAYVLHDCEHEPRLVVVATGSEVGLARAAIADSGALSEHIRLVSMPCVEVFLEQDDDYRQHVLPPNVPVLTVEAGLSTGLNGYLQPGNAIGVDTFGESAPAAEVFAHFGLTVNAVRERIASLCG